MSLQVGLVGFPNVGINKIANAALEFIDIAGIVEGTGGTDLGLRGKVEEMLGDNARPPQLDRLNDKCYIYH
ncbi:hypothetical protein KKB83_02485 [Patescibacteria group bacterium]|nr:hypothetical protein [Patescibacteria group bacterium]